MRKLIIEADDFGLSPGINKGIKEVINYGIVRSTNVLINFSYSEEATELQNFYPNISIGVHINVTCGYPISDSRKVKSIIDPITGEFYGYRDFVKRITHGRIVLKELETEFIAQMQKALDLGLKITHVNTHHGIHRNPIVFMILLRVCKKFNITKVRTPKYYYINDVRKSFKYVLKKFSGDFENIYARMKDFKMADNYIVLKNKDSLENWLALERIPKRISEVCCHPGYVDDILKKYTTYIYEREMEVKILTSEELLEFLNERRIELISFRDI